LSACELRLQPIEKFIRGTGASPVPNEGRRRGGEQAGAPNPAGAAKMTPPGTVGSRGEAARGGRAPLTPEQEAAQKAAADELRRWRLSLSEDVFRAFRRKYEDAGIRIRVLKVDNIDTFADDVVDYSFTVARLLGAEALSTEVPLSASKRIGQFAEKHKMLVGYHGHTDINNPEAFGSPQSWETAMSYSKYNGWNLDLGHFFASTNLSPIPFLEKYHDRISHLHLKDRKKNMGSNVPWGQGDTPLAESLQLLRDRKWDIMGAIEMEHPTPPGSDPMTELGKCIQFCEQALL
jgi:sugar phosphate isomerase/epimerase